MMRRLRQAKEQAEQEERDRLGKENGNGEAVGLVRLKLFKNGCLFGKRHQDDDENDYETDIDEDMVGAVLSDMSGLN